MALIIFESSEVVSRRCLAPQILQTRKIKSSNGNGKIQRLSCASHIKKRLIEALYISNESTSQWPREAVRTQARRRS